MFSKQFDFNPHSLINFVGGGGKSMLIYRLMDEFIEKGHVLYTTTTRIHPPQPDKGLITISSDNSSLQKMLITEVATRCKYRNYKIVATRHFMEPDLLQGVCADFASDLDRSLFYFLLNEADGSARFSIKLPREGEPVLMDEAEYLIPVIGLDCIGKAAGPEVLFRFQTQASLFSVRENETVTPELAANLLMHPRGVCRHWKEGTTIIPYINKVDTPEQDETAKELAILLLQNNNFPVLRVVWGSVRNTRCSAVSGS